MIMLQVYTNYNRLNSELAGRLTVPANATVKVPTLREPKELLIAAAFKQV
jgi:hypothetical protein